MPFLKEIKDFLTDLFNTKLLILKCTYFLLLAAVVISWPQMTIHQKTLGLTEYQTGITSTVYSVLSMCYPFLSGIIGDKLGNYRIPMVVISMITGVLALLFTYVPSSVIQTTSLNINNVTRSNFSSETSSLPPQKTVTGLQISHQSFTFGVYITIRTLYGVFQGATYGLFEAAVMASVQNSDINYGYQRAWGTVGVIISSYLSGIIVEKTGGFNEIFYISAALQVATGVLMMFVNMEFKIPATSLTKDILHYFFKIEVQLFFGAMAAAGMFIGYLETFMYRYLSSLGATPVLIGLTVTVGAPFELILTLVTSHVVKLTGHAPLIMFGLLAYAIRFLGFSYLQDPWWVLPLEILESVANGLLFTSAIMYCTVLFPTHTIASFRGVFSVIYFGLGRLVGITVGSEIREQVGHIITFRIWASIAFVCAAVYYLVFTVLMKYRSQNFSIVHIQRRENNNNNKEVTGIDNQAWDGYT